MVNGPWLFYRGLRYLELVSRLVGNFLRKVITIRLLEAIVGIYQIGVILFCSIILILRGVYMERILIIINIV